MSSKEQVQSRVRREIMGTQPELVSQEREVAVALQNSQEAMVRELTALLLADDDFATFGEDALAAGSRGFAQAIYVHQQSQVTYFPDEPVVSIDDRPLSPPSP